MTPQIDYSPMGQATVRQNQEVKSMQNLGAQIGRWLLLATLCISSQAHAASTDWGVINVAEQPTSISFSESNISKNFTDQYSFALQSSADASSAVAVTFDPCARGCGNPSLTYGVYDASGGLVSTVGSSATTLQLASGNYVFQVKGTGMGAGNTVSYSGTITFYSTAGVQLYASAVPEPADYLLMLTGTSLLAWAVRRRNKSLDPATGGVTA